MPNNYPNNRPQGLALGMAPGMIPQEITLPDGVPASEVVVYDESRGVNLFGTMPNTSEQDQLAALVQQMAMPTAVPTVTPTMTNSAPVVAPQMKSATPRVNLPVTEAETRMREFQLRSATQNETPGRSVHLGTNRSANHQVAGRLENGVGRVSQDAFDAIGRLGRAVNLGEDAKKYALVDANGKAICLVTPTPGVALEPYVNQTVGVTGIWGLYVREGESFRQISAKAVYPIKGTGD
jgi:hypothetical protein